MNVLCSGEVYDKPINTTTCLACCIEKGSNPPCGYGYRLLYSMFKGMEDRSDEIHVTDLTSCLLKAYMDKIDPAPKRVHEILPLWIGIAIHDALDMNNDYVTSEITVDYNGVVGRVDAVIYPPEMDTIIEDTKTKRWMSLSQNVSPENARQVNMYRVMRGKQDKMQIQYIDMSGPSKCRKKECKRATMQMINGVVQCPKCGNTSKEFHLGASITQVDVQQDTPYFIAQRYDILNDALCQSKAPDAEPGWMCGYCPHTWCAHNKNNEGEE